MKKKETHALALGPEGRSGPDDGGPAGPVPRKSDMDIFVPLGMIDIIACSCLKGRRK